MIFRYNIKQTPMPTHCALIRSGELAYLYYHLLYVSFLNVGKIKILYTSYFEIYTLVLLIYYPMYICM